MLPGCISFSAFHRGEVRKGLEKISVVGYVMYDYRGGIEWYEPNYMICGTFRSSFPTSFLESHFSFEVDAPGIVDKSSTTKDSPRLSHATPSLFKIMLTFSSPQG
ncbi:uncharacterized protein MYCFIDRAFT_207180 [Pseudocercospora fijiensis CIRAD86]|uniref:Uncharacterized protein n=1 Tax=Pseudocercospora fijiensis (strain CIRAD86) TaxID=383855 RepID=M3B420_PSEFD|nr:uncharacterized protein MYCFIDRAFT_207180 [Pseudocercospora fijiensis CIRAD86]EME84128.1 hypothetical protein MYCFIDRAFT_207180 [Pseudocercospora fijiensis CIRAD86]